MTADQLSEPRPVIRSSHVCKALSQPVCGSSTQLWNKQCSDHCWVTMIYAHSSFYLRRPFSLGLQREGTTVTFFIFSPFDFYFWSKKKFIGRRVPIEKRRTLMVPKIHLKKVQSSGFFYVKGRGNGRGCSRLPLVISMSTSKTKQKLLA